MATAAPARRKRRTPPARRGPTDGWWGNGDAPWVRWPGVTIAIEAVWSDARERWESRDGKYFYDQAAADRAVDFFPEYLRHHIGEWAGQPFQLQPYQELLLTRPLFGWKRASDGLRRFRRLFGFIPKGAGKSPWGSGTGLFLTCCDNEPAAEVYAVAGDKAQARIVHDNAKIMVETSPDLDDMLEVTKDAIVDASTHSKLQVLSSEAGTKHGFRPHGVVFDEFHNQPDRDLFEALKKSTVKRRQPLLLIITHAGDDDEGICYEEYEYAKKILSGTVPDETFLPVIFEASKDDDWTDPAVWARVNPGHGVTVKHDGIAAECEEAKAEPRKLNDFLRFHLNRWVNAASAWIPVDHWDKCDGKIDLDALAAIPVHAGLDLAQKYDMAALSLVFAIPLAGAAPEIEVVGTDEAGETLKRNVSLNFEIAILPAFWIPEATMRDHEKSDGIPFTQWRDAGLITVTEGDVIDYDAIVRDIEGPILEQFPRLKQGQIGYDPAFATDIALKLGAKGLTCVEVLQNYKQMSEPCHIFEALVKARRVRHDGHRVLRWNVENAQIKRDDAGRIRPVKPKRASRRIDGLVGALMGISRSMLQPAQPGDTWSILTS